MSPSRTPSSAFSTRSGASAGTRVTTHKRLASTDSNVDVDNDGDEGNPYPRGSKVQVEVTDFGPLGASVDMVGIGHEQDNLLPVDKPPYGKGLILQDEISYFRAGRGNLDVVRGEVLPAYVIDTREDGKMLFGLRVYGKKAKADQVAERIMELLRSSSNGVIDIGDRSTPEEISRLLPGVSKSGFKRAVGNLYRKGLVKPAPDSVTIVD